MSDFKKNNKENESVWVRVLDKGMVTLPKKFRTRFNFDKGDMLKARLVDNGIFIEPLGESSFRNFGQDDLDKMLEEDKLPENLAREARDYWKDLP